RRQCLHRDERTGFRYQAWDQQALGSGKQASLPSSADCTEKSSLGPEARLDLLFEVLPVLGIVEQVSRNEKLLFRMSSRVDGDVQAFLRANPSHAQDVVTFSRSWMKLPKVHAVGNDLRHSHPRQSTLRL